MNFDLGLLGFGRISRAGLWYEPPTWAPKWLHLHTCTFCRSMLAQVRREERELGWRRPWGAPRRRWTA